MPSTHEPPHPCAASRARASPTSTPRYSSTSNRGWLGITSPGGAFQVSSRISVVLPAPDREDGALRVAQHGDRPPRHPDRAAEHLTAVAADLVHELLDVLVAEVGHPARRRVAHAGIE